MLWYEKTTVSSYSLLICQYVTLPLFRYSAFHFITLVFSSLVKQILQRIVIRWEASFPLFLSLVSYLPSLSLSLSRSSYSPRAFFPSIKNQIFSFHRLVWIASFLQPGSIRIHPLHNQEVVTEDSTLSHWAWERGSERKRERETEKTIFPTVLFSFPAHHFPFLLFIFVDALAFNWCSVQFSLFGLIGSLADSCVFGNSLLNCFLDLLVT